ncbi:MAG: hypothetical protein WAN87_07235 [Thermoplasmata archaeon]
MRILSDRRSPRDFWRLREELRWATVGLGVALLIVSLALPVLVGVASGTPISKPTLPPSATVDVQWNATPTNLSNGFWGADVRIYSEIGSPQVSWWQASPLTVARWPGGAVADGYNYTSNVITKTGGGIYTPPQDEQRFIAWCEQVHCEAIFGVPAEINQPATAAYYVAYTENTLHFHPAYWEIGNEPALWEDFNLPWSKWNLDANSPVTPAQYAQVVHAYIAAMRAVDPTIQIIGLPGTGVGGSADPTWLTDTIALNGPNLSAVAIHVYSAGDGNGTPTLPGFFASLMGRGSLEARIPIDRQAIAAACPSCGPIPIFVTEFGSGNGGGTWDGYMKTYPDVPYMAASLIQGITLSVSNIDLFAFQSTYPGSLYNPAGVESPVGELYEEVLPQLGSLYVPTSLSAPIQGIYAAATLGDDGSEAALLIVNANATSSVTIPIGSAGFPQGGPAQETVWNQSASGPTSWGAPNGVGPSLILPPASLALVRAPFSHGSIPPTEYAVTFSETGLPSDSDWSVQINGQLTSTTGTTAQTELENGSYPYVIESPGSYEASPASGTIVIQGNSVRVPIDFQSADGGSSTYVLQFSPTGLPPTLAWGVDVSASEAEGTGNLSVSVPNGTYAYSVSAPAGFTPSPLAGNVTIQGRAVTVPVAFRSSGNGAGDGTNYTVTFHQSGLGTSISWWVSLKGDPADNESSTGPTVSLSLANGSYDYLVGASAGYVPTVPSGQFSVLGAGSTIVVAFNHLNSTETTPPDLYGFLPPFSGATLNWYVIGVVGAVAAWLIGMVDFFVVRLATEKAGVSRSPLSSWRRIPPRSR